MIFAFVGFILGYIICSVRNDNISIPKELEHLRKDKETLEYDLTYYKRLTKNLVNENSELRKNVRD
jgi:glucose-6-phosphate-specific signal transduction histidine kinase